MKQMLKRLVRHAALRAPWGARQVMLDACIERTRIGELCARVLPRCNIIEVAATGDRGVVTSAASDSMVISEYARTGTFAADITAVLTDFFEPDGGTYIDVGANIGLMTIPLARNPRIRCLAFEPEPANFDFLVRNIARNVPDHSVELHQVALFHSHSSLSLAIADGNIGDHRLTLSGVPGRRTVEVPALPLDDFVDRISGRLAVKVDTQGAEPFIVAGGRAVFAMADLLAMEFCPYLMRQLGGDPNLVIALVQEFDQVAVMRGGKAETPRYGTGGEAARILRNKLETAADTDEDYLDILARRRSAVTARMH